MQLRLQHLERVRTWGEQYDMEATAEWKDKPKSKSYLMAFNLRMDGASRMDDVIDALEQVQETTLTVCSIQQDGSYLVTVESDVENWRGVRKLLSDSLTKNVPVIAPEDIVETKKVGRLDPGHLLEVDRIRIEIGYGLLPVVEDFLSQLSGIRKSFALGRGIVIPVVRVVDNPELGPNEYSILINEVKLAWGTLHHDKLLALDGLNELTIGEQIVDPSTDSSARWITPDDAKICDEKNILVVRPGWALGAHMSHICAMNIASLLSRQQVYELLDRQARKCPHVMQKVLAEKCTIPQLHEILRHLLRTGGSIRNLEGILEDIEAMRPEAVEKVLEPPTPEEKTP